MTSLPTQCDHQLELSHHRARTVEVAACAFKYQASGGGYDTEITPPAFSLGRNPQGVPSKHLKGTRKFRGSSVSSVWLSALPMMADGMDGERRGSHPRAGGKSEEQLEGGKEQTGDSPVSLPCLRKGDLKQCGITHLPKD